MNRATMSLRTNNSWIDGDFRALSRGSLIQDSAKGEGRLLPFRDRDREEAGEGNEDRGAVSLSTRELLQRDFSPATFMANAS